MVYHHPKLTAAGRDQLMAYTLTAIRNNIDGGWTSLLRGKYTGRPRIDYLMGRLSPVLSGNIESSANKIIDLVDLLITHPSEELHNLIVFVRAVAALGVRTDFGFRTLCERCGVKFDNGEWKVVDPALAIGVRSVSTLTSEGRALGEVFPLVVSRGTGLQDLNQSVQLDSAFVTGLTGELHQILRSNPGTWTIEDLIGKHNLTEQPYLARFIAAIRHGPN